jgi:DNA replication protein DnaC
MRVYDERRFGAKRALDLRKAAVYEKAPEIEGLESRIHGLALRRARMLLAGDDAEEEKARIEMGRLRTERGKALAAAGFAPDELTMRPECPDCGDTGYIDGGKCHCFRREEIRLLYAQSNLDAVLERENFGTFSLSVYDSVEVHPKLATTVAAYMEKVLLRCRRFADSFGTKPENLLFTGSTGVGKTFLTHCIAKALIDTCHSVIYLTAHELFDIFSKNTFDSGNDIDAKEEMRNRVSHILECDLLIIDDLGTELSNSFTVSQLFYCLNDRLISGRGTIISTNLSANMLRDVYTERISSRITNAFDIIPLYGDDIRLKMRAR